MFAPLPAKRERYGSSSDVEIYKRRKPQETSLWKLLNHHFLEFEERYDDLFQQ
jgi:hypothetical protein